MITENSKDTDQVCIIRANQRLDETWADWLGDFKIMPQADGSTILSNFTDDQSIILGALEKIHALGLSFDLVVVGGCLDIQQIDLFADTLTNCIGAVIENDSGSHRDLERTSVNKKQDRFISSD